MDTDQCNIPVRAVECIYSSIHQKVITGIHSLFEEQMWNW